MSIPKLSLSVPKDVTNFIVPFVALFFLAILFATNGVGSTGILVIFAYIAWSEPELRNRWWKAVWPWLLVIVIYFIMMSFIAFSKMTALRDGVEVIKGVGLSLVALYLRQFSECQLRRVTISVVSVLTVITLGIVGFNLHQHSIISFIHNQQFDWYVNRNRLAVGFSVTSVFVAALMVGEKSRCKSVLWSIFWITLLIAGLLNGSRGAVMGMIVATISIIVAALPRLGLKQVFRLELWAVPITIMIGIVSWIIYKEISLKMFFWHDDKGIDTGRFYIWKAVEERVAQAPWFGYGPHAMKFDPALSIVAVRNTFGINHPHSIYLGLVYASGIVGVLCWMIWFFTFSRSIKMNFMTKNELSYYIGIGLLVNMLVHGFVDFDLYIYSVFAYIIVGLVMLLPSNLHRGLKI
jgi:O-antigen ligase